MEGNQSIHKFRHQMIATFQGDAVAVHRQSIKSWTVATGESFQAIQGIFLVKHLGVALELSLIHI